MFTSLLKAFVAFLPILMNWVGEKQDRMPGEEGKNYLGMLSAILTVVCVAIFYLMEHEISERDATILRLSGQLERCHKNNSLVVNIPGQLNVEQQQNLNAALVRADSLSRENDSLRRKEEMLLEKLEMCEANPKHVTTPTVTQPSKPKPPKVRKKSAFELELERLKAKRND